MKKIFYLLALAVISLASCKKDPGGITPEQLQAILLGKDTLHMYVGEVRQINFKVTPSTYDTTTLKWNSSDPSVISVTNLGKISALKTGSSTVSVSNQASTVSISCLITVVPLVDTLKLGLIAYYPFNNSAADSSGNFNNGTVHGATLTTNRFGTANSAYLFDGISNNIQVADRHQLRLDGTDFTINTWVNLSDFDPSYGTFIISKRTAGVADGWGSSITGYGFQSSGQGAVGLAFFGPGGNISTSISNSSITLNKWFMITTTYSLDKQEIKFYINGVLDNTVDNIPSPNGSIAADMFIGSDNPSSPSTGYFVKGKVDDIRIYNRLLKPAEITKLFNLTY
jgi:hypothetical protein